MLDVLCAGHAAWDITMAVAHHPGRDEKVHATAMTCSGGGPAANAAVTVARLGGRSAFAGFLGNDNHGRLHVEEFRTEGVDTCFLARGDEATPVSIILAKPDGSRCVINHKSHTPWLAPERIDFSMLHTRAILVDGHEPLVSQPLAKHARAHSIPVILDAGSVHRGTRELVSQVDYLVASARFALDYSGAPDTGAALNLLADIAPNVVITLGQDGLIWTRGGSSGACAAFDVKAVDTTGAGDAFHGAFALGVARGMDWDALLHFASATGALTCTRLGARAGIPTADDVKALLERCQAC